MRKIKTEDDYNAAVKRLNNILDQKTMSDKDTKEAQHLSEIIEKYENNIISKEETT